MVAWDRTKNLRGVLGFAAVLVVLATAGCGCGRRAEKRGTADQLAQKRLMFSSDEKGRTCYVKAEVENVGDLPINRAKITATLRSSSGKPRGVNHCFLRDVKPGERRTCSLTVAAHDSFQHVELSFTDPEGE
jgi:hypothetical protein